MRIGITEAAKTVLPGVRAGFDKGLVAPGGDAWKDIAEDWDSSSKTETYSRLVGTGAVREWDANRIAKGGAEHYFQVTNLPYEITLRVDWELILFDKLAQVNKMAEGYGREMARYPEKLIFELMAAAGTTATFTGDDETYIVDTAHTDVGSGNTHSNKGTAALSVTALAAGRVAGMKVKNAAGSPMPIIYNKLVVGPDLAQTAFELTTAPKDPENANNTPNWHYGLDVIVNPYLTDTNDWFLLCTNQAFKPFAMQFVERPTPMYIVEDRLRSDKFVDYGAHMHGQPTFTDWRLIYGGIVA